MTPNSNAVSTKKQANQSSAKKETSRSFAKKLVNQNFTKNLSQSWNGVTNHNSENKPANQNSVERDASQSFDGKRDGGVMKCSWRVGDNSDTADSGDSWRERKSVCFGECFKSFSSL